MDKGKIWRDNNREHLNNYMKEYNSSDDRKLKLKEINRIYVLNNKESIRDQKREYMRSKRKDPMFKFKDNIRTLISNSLRNKGFKKNIRSVNILGCSIEDFKLYIESKFEPWMNWKNKGLYNNEFNFGWDIDHIIPLSSAISEEDLINLNHYTNFQPLCSKINRDIKKDKLDYDKH